MAKSRLEQCRSGEDFLKFASKRGAAIVQGGRHAKVVTGRGVVAVPRHRGDMPTGTRHAILKAFARLGLLAIFLTCALSLYAHAALASGRLP